MQEFLRRCQAFGIVAVVLLAIGTTVRAQNVTGTLTGTIVDQQGNVLPGATVTIINESTREPRLVTTDSRGIFQVTTLPPGSYTVRVELANFAPPSGRVTCSAPPSACPSARFLSSLAGSERRSWWKPAAPTSTPPKHSTAA